MQQALLRMVQHQLGRAWASWLQQYAELQRQRQLLRGVGARISYPRLSACYTYWRHDWLRQVELERAAARRAIEAAEAAARKAAAEAAAAQKRHLLRRLHQMHVRDFTPRPPNAAHAAYLVWRLESRLGTTPPALMHKRPVGKTRRPPSLRLRDQPRASPLLMRPRCGAPPSLAVALGPPSLWSEYERRLQASIAYDVVSGAPADRHAASMITQHVEGNTDGAVMASKAPQRPFSAQPVCSNGASVQVGMVRSWEAPSAARPGSARLRPRHRTPPVAVGDYQPREGVYRGPAG